MVGTVSCLSSSPFKFFFQKPQPGMGKPLSIQDFAVIDTSLDRGANLQCIWCGMFMTAEALAMHFSEVHPEEVEVPKCNLCLQVYSWFLFNNIWE